LTQSPGLLTTILSFLACIGPLVFVHELGHYLVGRWCGVKADIFSIGFGREVAGWTDKRGTRWKIGWLPLGGYVRFKGDMNPASQPSPDWLALSADERAQTFQAKAVWQRVLIVAAGPIVNFLFAILLFMGIFAAIGYPTAAPVVTGVVAAGPAQQAGVMPGDRLISINGRVVQNFAQVQDYVLIRPSQQLELLVRRGEREIGLKATTGARIQQDSFGNKARVGTLGVVSNAVTLEKVPLAQLPYRAFRQTRDTVEMMVVTLGQLIVGDRSVKELGGPLKIAEISGQQASLGWLPFLWLMAVISINLGFINLLPIPLLDGGHLLFYGLEAVRRKPVQPKAQEWAFRTGLAALLALMVFVTINDLASFGVWQHLGG